MATPSSSTVSPSFSSTSLLPLATSATDSQISSVAMRDLLRDKTLSSEPSKAINNFQLPSSFEEDLYQAWIRSEYNARAVEVLIKEAEEVTKPVTSFLTWIRECPLRSALFDEASDTPSRTKDSQKTLGAYKIVFGPITEHDFGAHCSSDLRSISVSPQDEASSNNDLLFELTNAVHAQAFEQSKDELELGKLGINEYAIVNESIEFQGVERHMDIMGDSSQFAECFGDRKFHTYLKAQKASGHTDYYRDDARTIIRRKIGDVIGFLKMPQIYIETLANRKFNDTELDTCMATLAKHKDAQDADSARTFLEGFLRPDPALATPLSNG